MTVISQTTVSNAFWDGNVRISIRISRKYIPKAKGQIDN